MAEKKAEFENTTGGFVSVVKIDGKGEAGGEALRWDETVWLSEEEINLTANAPRQPKDNPFLDGTGKDGAPALRLVTEMREVPQTREVPDIHGDEETGRAAEPAGEAAEGSYASGEEVGSPDAPAAS